MKLYIILIILIIILLPLIIFLSIIYIRYRKFLSIKGNKPDVNIDINKKEPYILSSYKHDLDLTKFFLNRYEITCEFYSDYKLFIDINVFDKGKNIAKNEFHNNTWKVIDTGYSIIYGDDLINEIKNAPILCSLNPNIKYTKGNPNKIIVSGSVKAIITLPINETVEQCTNLDCS